MIEGFLDAGRGGMVVRCYSMEIRVRMDQDKTFHIAFLPAFHSQPQCFLRQGLGEHLRISGI